MTTVLLGFQTTYVSLALYDTALHYFGKYIDHTSSYFNKTVQNNNTSVNNKNNAFSKYFIIQ